MLGNLHLIEKQSTIEITMLVLVHANFRLVYTPT